MGAEDRPGNRTAAVAGLLQEGRGGRSGGEVSLSANACTSVYIHCVFFTTFEVRPLCRRAVKSCPRRPPTRPFPEPETALAATIFPSTIPREPLKNSAIHRGSG